ncbi:MAG TPA: hypothetical protein VHW23_29835 [Kofleriaceae bacterium]|nr:hypothetical protein [Kofleriaceae bacterium]
MPVTTSFVTTRVCLGAAHYAPESTSGPGAPLPLSMLLADVLGGALAACDPGASQLILDHVDIVPATAADGCPDPGQVPNGDAEGSGGWTFSTSGSFGMAAIVAGIGAGGSHGVQLQVGRGCASATATLSVSVPLASAQGSPALTLYHDGAVGGFTVGLGDLELPLSGGAQRTDRYCVPSTMRGEVFPLTALLEGVSGDCTDLTSAQEVLDNVAIENDPACGIDPGIADPGFEATSKLLGADAIGTGTAKVVADAAHGGHVLQLTRGNTCDEASFEIDVATPAVRPGEGAGVAFSYSLSASANALTVSSSTQTFTAKRGGWTQGMVCLDPRHPGAPQRVFIDLSTASSSCNTIQPADTAEIDDLSAISTPACPAM